MKFNQNQVQNQVQNQPQPQEPVRTPENRLRRALILILALVVVVAIAIGAVVWMHFREKNAEDASSTARELEAIRNAEVGDVVTFGTFEQDAELANGHEPVEWKVLEKNDTEALLITRYGLACLQYHSAKANVSWKTCSLRSWLNQDFYETAFSGKEQDAILTAVVQGDEDPDYTNVPQSDTTIDHVFILSTTEAAEYLPSPADRICKPTDYAVVHGAYVSSSEGNCWWWLRTAGRYEYYAADVYDDGTFDYEGNIVRNSDICIRPAIWVSLK